MDCTVRLWHLTQPDCLKSFRHSDFVTCVQAHPTDAHRFVSGSIDGKLRVWDVLEGSVLASGQLHQDMVTAVSFSPGGSRVVAGTMRGKLRYYELGQGGRKLEYAAQVDVRNARGHHAGGRKVTSILAVPDEPGSWLVTSNDSRLRLVQGYGVAVKFKGHRNAATQLRGALAPGCSVAHDANAPVTGVVFLPASAAGDGAGTLDALSLAEQQQHQQQQQQQQQEEQEIREVRHVVASCSFSGQLRVHVLFGRRAL
ncbi:WD repeat-containing protein 44 [Monoraphidium neglectum]|uniref:WD repeat-containing protein 44 n=1 Tax=Monoraphidium neglectum TaxID=145388 RepID=A0A0D2IVI7_9CHLO|nr:WD repeat-containing protein 44 [Monoraphidium neglectum]KIY91962.1 WD repeat-containing protein 44 [Monoraphidium neglectum]|eukprot:XP_013890982.1 WD repeat-containing protein 44 [Monoraphidium neglectum]